MKASAEAVAAAAASCSGVARLSRGMPVEVATYLPGKRIYGVRVSDRFIEVHIVAHIGTVLPEVASQVRRAVAPLAPDCRIDVFVDDLESEPEAAETSASSAPPQT
jgi:hypothetical protein